MKKQKSGDGAQLKKPPALPVILVAIGVAVLVFSGTAYYYEMKISEIESENEKTIQSLQQENENMSELLNDTVEVVERLPEQRVPEQRTIGSDQELREEIRLLELEMENLERRNKVFQERIENLERRLREAQQQE
jgi:predicted RNase H-like nuclease (RuvC/YqgF family)